MSNLPTDTPDDTKDLALAYYNRAISELGQDKAAGEARFNFFLTIVTASIGGLLVLDGMQPGTFAPVLLGLTFLGITTHGRMLRRQLDLTRQRLQMYHVEQYFVGRDPALARYLFDRFSHSVHAGQIGWKQALFGSGLRLTIAVINALLFGTAIYIFAVWRFDLVEWFASLIALAAAIVLYVLQAMHYRVVVREQYEKWQAMAQKMGSKKSTP
jgi:hypothetical protein